MNISVIVAHPDPESFNCAIASEVRTTLSQLGIESNFHDLYREEFDCILPKQEIQRLCELPCSIEQYCKELQNADGIVIIHPNWWGQPPAILKGWIDRIIRPGIAYEFVGDDGGEGIPRGLLNAKFAVVFNTSNTEEEREREVFGDPLELIWRDCIFGLCGVGNFERKMFRVMITSSSQERKNWLREVSELIERKVRIIECEPVAGGDATR